MKNTLFYLLIPVIIVFTSSATIIKSDVVQIKECSSNFVCAPHFEIDNYSSNSITSVVVQATSTTTYNNPTFPILFTAAGNVTIIVHFAQSGPSGGIRSYEDIGGAWTLIGCETYDPRYLSPISLYGSSCTQHFLVTINNVICP